MIPRLVPREVGPDGFKLWIALQRYINSSGLEQSLLTLIMLRSSQIEGCAYCIDAHTKDARAQGETEQRLYVLSAWRETPFYTERERAALAWTETLTLMSENSVPDAQYESMLQQFTEKELFDLTLAVIYINGWNRIANSFGMLPGSYDRQSVKRHLKEVA
ncbi:MAG TPA: carboxymuconolactone decarboxylase family protein [Anaerolineales bacterium]